MTERMESDRCIVLLERQVALLERIAAVMEWQDDAARDEPRGTQVRPALPKRRRRRR